MRKKSKCQFSHKLVDEVWVNFHALWICLLKLLLFTKHSFITNIHKYRRKL